MQISRSAACPSVAMFARPFSQTRVARTNGEEAKEEQAVVDAAVKSTESPGSTAELIEVDSGVGSVVFVSNITFEATEMHLREAFAKYGDVSEVSIGRDGRGLSRG
jgi:nucleolin